MDTVKIGFHLIIRYLASLIMSFVVFLSITAIFTLPLTEAIGYDAYVSDKETGRSEKVYTHYFADGEDIKKAEYEARGLTVFTAELRSELTGAGTALVFTVAQVLSIALFFALISNYLHRIGGKDAEECMEHSAVRWLIPSLFPAAVSFAGFALLVLNKLQLVGNYGLSLYRYTNYHLYGLQRILIGTGNDGSQISWISVLLAILPTALTFAACAVSYEFGYRGFHPFLYLKNKIKYKGDT